MNVISFICSFIYHFIYSFIYFYLFSQYFLFFFLLISSTLFSVGTPIFLTNLYLFLFHNLYTLPLNLFNNPRFVHRMAKVPSLSWAPLLWRHIELFPFGES